MRVQLALNVENLEESITFYSKMFATEPYKVKEGYANFAVAEPPLKLVLFETPGAGGTLNHLGVEVENAEQVEAAEARLTAGGLDTTGVDDVVCCYAGKTETWVEGPDTRWEWYVKTEDAESLDYQLKESTAGESVCCQPTVSTASNLSGTVSSYR